MNRAVLCVILEETDGGRLERLPIQGAMLPNLVEKAYYRPLNAANDPVRTRIIPQRLSNQIRTLKTCAHAKLL